MISWTTNQTCLRVSQKHSTCYLKCTLLIFKYLPYFLKMLLRDHSSITSSKRWVGGVVRWPNDDVWWQGGGWGWLNADVSKKISVSELTWNLFILSRISLISLIQVTELFFEPELVCSMYIFCFPSKQSLSNFGLIY